MKAQIVDNLNKFMIDHPIIKEECEVIYLLVELRKLLDRNIEINLPNKYSLVRFHADWIVHTRKDYITPTMKKIMTDIENSIDIHPKNRSIVFLLMPDFRNELSNLLKENCLPYDFCEDDKKWLYFILALTQVLADQPIINPTVNIAEFRYVAMNKSGIMANIDFTGSRQGQSITLGFGI